MKYLKKAHDKAHASLEKLRADVAAIVADVAENGDEALQKYNEAFDGCKRTALRVARAEIDAAYAELDKGEIADIRAAAANIERFAREQRRTVTDLPSFEPSPGVRLGHRVIPVRSCCCYVPGGNYPLYSSALMLVIPAKVAGVSRVAACSPVMRGTDRIDPRTLVAMDVAGADEIYAVGGAQAIAAFSYGTAQIAQTDMIVGPGNAYVTEAKRQCFGSIGIDFVAGPSEVLVIADATAPADVIAADLLAQSEHDRNAAGVVVTTDEALGKKIMAEVARQLDTLETAEIARDAWEQNGEVIVADSIDEAVAVANDRAPEHLEVQTADPEAVAKNLYNYGSLFLGAYTAEVFGDYASGTNHTLPTLRAARYTGGVWVGTFLKTCTHQSMTREAMKEMAPLVSRLARGEGLIAHARAAEIREEKFRA